MTTLETEAATGRNESAAAEDNVNKCSDVEWLNKTFFLCDIKSIKLWVILFLIIILTIVIFRYSLENMVAWAIILTLLFIPCCFFCGIKCRFKSLIKTKYSCIIYSSGVIIGIILGSIWRLSDMCYFEEPTFDAWDVFYDQQYDGTIKALVNSAVLASNPHNTQAWKFKIDENNQYLDIFVDFDRNIEWIDILYREMHIGIGCAIQNAYIASIFHGYSPHIIYYPDGIDDDNSFVARIELGDNSLNQSYNLDLNDNLYISIPDRHTNRDYYDESAIISDSFLNDIDDFNEYPDILTIYWFKTDDQKSTFKDIEINAAIATTEDENQSIGGHKWFRNTCFECKKLKSGIWLDAQAFIPDLDFQAKLFPPVGRVIGDGYFVNQVRNKHTTASVFGMICVQDQFNNTQRMLVGELWQKIHLYAVYNDIDMQPLNQIFERTDMETYNNENDGEFIGKVNELLSDTLNIDMDNTNLIQCLFAFRGGFATSDRGDFAAPRRDANTVIVE